MSIRSSPTVGSVESVPGFGSETWELTYEMSTGEVANELFDPEAQLGKESAASVREGFILGIALSYTVGSGSNLPPRQPFRREPGPGVTRSDDFALPLARAERPRR